MLVTTVPIALGPEIFGLPVAVLAFIVSLFSFCVAVFALGWQIVKHNLDGGRVRVYLNTAVLEPEYMLTTNRSGQFMLRHRDMGRSITHGHALELAQLIVENPGKVPVTVYSPGFYFSGHGVKHHTVTPRMFATDKSMGSDHAITESVVRIAPYDRVTFLLDYWSVVSGILNESGKGKVDVRGFVGVAGRAKRPQKSSRKLRWQIKQGDYTAIENSPKFTPYAVIWGEMFRRLPERLAKPREGLASTPEVTRGSLRYILQATMARFEDRPERKLIEEAFEEEAKRRGIESSIVSSYFYEGYEALDQMEGKLTNWSEGIWDRQSESKFGDQIVADENCPQNDIGSASKS